MQIDKYKLSINRTTIELDGTLNRGNRCFVLLETEIYDVSHPDNQDGTFNEVFKSKHTGVAEVKQGERVIKVKDKGSMAQRLRFEILRLQDVVEKLDVEEEKFYRDLIMSIIANLPEIYQRYK